MAANNKLMQKVAAAASCSHAVFVLLYGDHGSQFNLDIKRLLTIKSYKIKYFICCLNKILKISPNERADYVRKLRQILL